jgi:glycosyltransferase involved in cell wall biosynthesis
MPPAQGLQPSLLSGQNLYLRLILLVLAFIGALEASLRQICLQIALLLGFMLLDLSLYSKLLRGLRISLPFFAAYWIFATLFGVAFPEMLLFTLKLVFFIIVTVYCFGNLGLERILRDTHSLRRYKWGKSLLRFGLATQLFLRGYARYFSRHKPTARTSVSNGLDSLFAAGAHVYRSSGQTEALLDRLLRRETQAAPSPRANLLALAAMALLTLINSV